MAYYNRSEGEQILDASLKMIKAMDAVDDMYQRDQQQVSQNNLIKLAQERGGLDRIVFNDVQNVHDWMALGALRKQNADMMSQQKDAYKDKIDFLNTQYNNEVMPMLRGATEAYNKGDYASYAGYVENLSNMAYSPYRYKFDPQSGSFLEYFRSDNKMGFTPTGRVYNPKEVQGYLDKMMSGTLQVQGGVNGQLMNINPDWAMTQLRMQLATADGNAQSMMQPKPVMGPDGKMYRASIINPIFDKERGQNLYNTGPALVVFDENGRQVDIVSAAEGKYQWVGGGKKGAGVAGVGSGGGRGRSGGGGGRRVVGEVSGPGNGKLYDVQRGDITTFRKMAKGYSGQDDPTLSNMLIQIAQHTGESPDSIGAAIAAIQEENPNASAADIVRSMHNHYVRGSSKSQKQAQTGSGQSQEKPLSAADQKVKDNLMQRAQGGSGSQSPVSQGSSARGIMAGIGDAWDRFVGNKRDPQEELLQQFFNAKKAGTTRANNLPEWLAEEHGGQRTYEMFSDPALYSAGEEIARNYAAKKDEEWNRENLAQFKAQQARTRANIEREQKAAKPY